MKSEPSGSFEDQSTQNWDKSLHSNCVLHRCVQTFEREAYAALQEYAAIADEWREAEAVTKDVLHFARQVEGGELELMTAKGFIAVFAEGIVPDEILSGAWSERLALLAHE